MDYAFRFANLELLYFLIPAFILLLLFKYKYYKPVIYKHTLINLFEKKGLKASGFYKNIFYLLRFCLILLLIFLIAKPQFADTKSKINVEGVDIILVIDASGSMICFDDINDRQSRIEIAKKEAIRFINKRENDPIGLIFFGLFALTKCPLTLDKKLLNELIDDFKIGEINHSETCLATAISTAINRLKNSKAKSKIIILLTDGEPTPSDMPAEIAIDIAKKMGIKIYTIGIGSEHGGYFEHPQIGIMPVGSKLNTELLRNIAQETGGKFFYAKNQADMRNIYDTIDKLEKTKIQTNIFNKYYDFFIPLIFLSIFLIFSEQLLATFIWFNI